MNEYPGDFSRALLLHNGKRKRDFFSFPMRRTSVCRFADRYATNPGHGYLVYIPSLSDHSFSKNRSSVCESSTATTTARETKTKSLHTQPNPPPEHCRVIIVKYRVPVILPSKRYPIKTRVHFFMSEQLAALQVNFLAALRDEIF